MYSYTRTLLRRTLTLYDKYLICKYYIETPANFWLRILTFVKLNPEITFFQFENALNFLRTKGVAEKINWYFRYESRHLKPASEKTGAVGNAPGADGNSPLRRELALLVEQRLKEIASIAL